MKNTAFALENCLAFDGGRGIIRPLFSLFFRVALLAVVIVLTSTSLTFAQNNTAPLHLFINGGGTVFPITNGQVLEVGQNYNMLAIPDPGYAFSSWQPANVFTFTTVTIDATGNASTNVSVVPSLLPILTNQPALNFVMQPEVVILDNPGVTMVTRGSGWEANFEPILLSIQLSDSEAILTWTNSGFSLQTAPVPLGVYTNISGAVSPYTNSITGPAQFFRLMSQ